MQKKYKLVSLLMGFFSLVILPGSECKRKSNPKKEKFFFLGEPERVLLTSCKAIIWVAYQEIVLNTAVYFIHELDSNENVLELKILKIVEQALYKTTLEAVKYSGIIVSSKVSLRSKAKRFAAMLAGGVLVKIIVKMLSEKQKTLKTDKTVSK